MGCTSLPTRKLFKLLITVSVSLLLYPLAGYSEVFNVTNEDELRSALSTAESNGEDDTINIAAGLYHTRGLPFAFASDEDFSLTIKGEGARSTILDGDETYSALEINAKSDADVFISISGLTIQNAYLISIPGDDSPLPLVIGLSAVSQNIEIENCEFINNVAARAGVGWGLYAISRNKIVLSGNFFSRNSGAFSGGGAYISAEELNISGNEFSANRGELGNGGGLEINASNFNYCLASITNNIFISNVSGGNGGGLRISLYCNNYDYKIINNTFTLNTAKGDGGGIRFSAIADDIDFVIQTFITDIYNNIIFNNFADGNGNDVYLSLVAGNAYSNVNISYNDFSDYCNFYSYQFCTQDANEAKNNINEDPHFVNAEAGDVSLLPDSPCIDAGDPNAPDVPDTDIYENPRVPPPDMGAVEYLEIVDGHEGKGGCSIANTHDKSSLSPFLAIPVLILIGRIVRRYRG